MGYLISTATKQKLQAVRDANIYLQSMFSGVVNQNVYKFPYRMDHFGRSKGESSYIAIVHADGNGMGNRFKAQGKGKTNRQYITAIREFSKSVHQAGKDAIKAVATTLIGSIQEGKVIGKLGEFKLNAQGYIPFRPLVYGGDDITFICEGRLGLDLATLFLQEFGEKAVTDGHPLTACAGICVVKTHYPFARAYRISEELCGKAKKFVKDFKKKYSLDYFSALDWHLATSGLTGSISDIRQREYQIEINNNIQHLSMRPIRLKYHDTEWRTWDFITEVIKEFKQGEDWKDRQNKVMALREVLREGSEIAVKDFISSYRLKKLPQFTHSNRQYEQLAEKGWLNGVCGYFDAIEAMEFYISLGE